MQWFSLENLLCHVGCLPQLWACCRRLSVAFYSVVVMHCVRNLSRLSSVAACAAESFFNSANVPPNMTTVRGAVSCQWLRL